MTEKQVIGKCSICGGRVLQYNMLHIVGPFPPPKCEKCGAVAALDGPVIPMKIKEKPTPPHFAYIANKEPKKWDIKF